MSPDAIGQGLHDRATRGEPLSADEEVQLRSWYARHDQEEAAQLGAAPVPVRLAELQGSIQKTSAEIVAQAKQIENLTAENARLRKEIGALQRQLSALRAGQIA